MSSRKRFLPGILVLAALCAATALRAEDSPQATAQRLCDALLGSMKQGPALGFAGRLRLLTPEIERDLDLPLMARLAIGPRWAGYSPEEHKELVQAFSDYSLANYANRFSGYSGEKFAVDPDVTRLERGDVIVHTRLIVHAGEPVHLDYLMRRSGADWRIIDVYLSGTISELATQRSEYSATLRDGGVPALVRLLRQKTAQLSR